MISFDPTDTLTAGMEVHDEARQCHPTGANCNQEIEIRLPTQTICKFPHGGGIVWYPIDKDSKFLFDRQKKATLRK